MGRRFQGIYAALTTPFVNDEISPDLFQANIEKYDRFGLSGYVILGSTGECVMLSDEESEKIVRTARAAARPGKQIIAGATKESSKWTIELIHRLADIPVDAALVRPHSYYKGRMSREALRTHFLMIADEAGVPVIVYNIPQNTGISLDAQLIVELSRHPNIAGLKESSGSIGYLGEVIRDVPADFHYFPGSGHIFFPALELGACGAILAVANAAPEVCVEIYGLFLEGKREEARKRQLELIPLNKAVTETYGIAGLKHAQDLRGFYGGPVRLPLLPLEDQGKMEITRLLEGLKLGAVD